MIKRVRVILIGLLFFSILTVPTRVQAAETAETPPVETAANAPTTDTTYAISILKYKLTETTELSKSMPLDGTKADKVTDANGEALDPLAGISYEITRVSPVQGASTFAPVQGSDAYSMTVTTDQNGLARVSGLASGTYQVIEKENQLLKSVMEPVIVELPLPQREGEALKEVYLYPKSSVLPAPENPKPGSPAPKGTPKGTKKGTPVASTQAASERIPQTSGTIGNIRSLYLILAFIVSMGILGIQVLRTKVHKF